MNSVANVSQILTLDKSVLEALVAVLHNRQLASILAGIDCMLGR